MDIITSHNALDFDGLASMVAAGKLYPGAIRVFSGTINKNVKKFMALYKDSLFIKAPKEINPNQVKRLVVVDTANANRLGQLKSVLDNNNLDIHIYDHHPVSADDLKGSLVEIHPTGAATTILVEKIMDRNIPISPFDATILALGIYDDTGSMLFPNTTARDAYAVAHLLSCGANLSVVANFMEKPFSEQQRLVLQKLLETSIHKKVSDLDIVLAIYDGNEFIPGLDLVTYRLLEMENCDAVFVIALMEGKVNVIGRSRSNNLKVNQVLQNMGGRGHDRAASAVIKSRDCQEIMEKILQNVEELIHPLIVAGDIMTSPVKTLPPTISMEEAGGIMLRYGHTGMPVVEDDNIVGVISRRDVDKARIHGLGHAPVKGFMTSKVLSISPQTTVSEIQKIMVEHDIGRLPVIDNGRLAGIVSRTDILRTLHGEDYPEDHEVLFLLPEGSWENCAELMDKSLPAQIIYYLITAGEVAQDLKEVVYCVGGFVRDLFLKVPNFDMDLVVEGDGQKLATELAERLGGKVRVHDRFRTAVVTLPDGTKIDVATARTEYYEYPAALPKVEKSSLKEDMYRRDFTINTLAICLNPGHFGDLIDYFGGRKDLMNGSIRILYNFSFVEDPTRILRAIRFEQRYRFTIEADTLRFARDAIERRMLGRLSYKRILAELILILNEKDPVPALERIRGTGVWKYLLPEIDVDDVSWKTIKRVPVVMGWWEEQYYSRKIKPWLIYIVVFFAQLSFEQVEAEMQRYPFDRYAKGCIMDSLGIPALAEDISRRSYLSPSDLDKMIASVTNENLIYLLLCIKDEEAWDRVARYLDLKDKIELEVNGYDLLELGLKPGPIFKEILDELYYLKLDEKIHNYEDEVNTLKQWIEEGRFTHAVRI
ncbi:Aldolase-type TIM barrel [Syntrophomonas zehnderi OL-4]|uniref:Aldolase-type TIM barrel n=1 Tax=Syntrophomonas zehnderi OL-4 TaxID=690567 RepID=A0A0E4GBN6_9FIRM|nr:CBS domain-containing protein [Syntrophomonas zehnderi]CFX94292.1 Aldolase-type TIM barrel [Syntrophomonas zehnderi OL-4]